MSYDYSSAVGLKPSALRPAGNLAVYDHIITRLREKVPSVVDVYGSDPDYHTVNAITYSLEYPERLIELPFVALTFLSEISKNIGLGQVAAGRDFGEYSGMTKNMLLQIDVWGRNSMERDLIADAVMHVMHISRNYFSSLGFRDIMPNLGQTRQFEQTRDTIYPRVSQTTSRVWRKVMSFNVEYDLVWVPPKEESHGIIEQIDVSGSVWSAEYEFRIGHVTDLILDSKYVLNKQMEEWIHW